MKLYGSFTSPFVRHCRIALMESGMEFEFIETDQASSAVKSPTKRVPFLEDGDVFLTDSSAILFYIRQKSGKAYLPTPSDLDTYSMVNTALDSTVNLFFLENNGIDINAFDYTKRQAARIVSSIAEFEKLSLPTEAPYNDVHLRLGCYLDWGVFRKRISIDNHPNLQRFLAGMAKYPVFVDTQIPR